MPIKILTWNVENFDANKLKDAEVSGYIKDVFKTSKADIIIIVEVLTAPIAEATHTEEAPSMFQQLIGDTGGVITLLDYLPGPSGTWALVPPRNLNNSPKCRPSDRSTAAVLNEGIAVFFKRASVEFIGPQVNTALLPATYTTTAPPTLATYTAPWDACLPDTAVAVPWGSVPQNQLSGMCDFPEFSASGRGLGNYRRPWLTRFKKVGGAETLSIFAVHHAIGRPSMIEVYNNIAMNWIKDHSGDTVVVCGDFNESPSTVKVGFSSCDAVPWQVLLNAQAEAEAEAAQDAPPPPCSTLVRTLPPNALTEEGGPLRILKSWANKGIPILSTAPGSSQTEGSDNGAVDNIVVFTPTGTPMSAAVVQTPFKTNYATFATRLNVRKQISLPFGTKEERSALITLCNTLRPTVRYTTDIKTIDDVKAFQSSLDQQLESFATTYLKIIATSNHLPVCAQINWPGE